MLLLLVNIVAWVLLVAIVAGIVGIFVVALHDLWEAYR